MRTLAALLLSASASFAGTAEIDAALKSIRAVGKEGAGARAASTAWKALAGEGASALVPTLKAFKDATPAATNWLRCAVDAIVEGEAKAKRELDAAALKTFVEDRAQASDARRIAYELFEKMQPDAAKALIAGLIHDTSLDLRRDAIAVRLAATPSDKTDLMAPLFDAARDRDQVEEIAKKLEKKQNDIVAHFNFITRWHVVGPFDGPEASGYGKVYEPETKVDLKATYMGKGGETIKWKAVAAKEITEQGEKDYCLVDLVKEVGKHKDAVAYAYAVIEVKGAMPVEVRAATQNAVKIFVNGKSIFEREAYHQGTMMDQHAGKVILKQGRNELLLKICQNDQKEPWAQRWVFQGRICDATGGRVPTTVVSPTIEEVK